VIEVRPVPWRYARRVCEAHHYLGAPQGHRFSLGVYDGHELLGVMIWGRPVARNLDDGETLEMTRMCLMVQRPNLASQSLGKAVKWIRTNRPERHLISYSDDGHRGTIYAAANWKPTPIAKSGKWRSGIPARANTRWEREITRPKKVIV
jgi:hypothetical protein